MPLLGPRTAQTVPGVYGHPSHPVSPGIVAGIVIGTALAFLIIIFSIYFWVNHDYTHARYDSSASALSSVMTASRRSHSYGRAGSYRHARTESEGHLNGVNGSGRRDSHVRTSHDAGGRRGSRVVETVPMAQRYVPPSEVTTNSDIITVEEAPGLTRVRSHKKPVPSSTPLPRRVVEDDVLDSESEDEEIVVEEAAPRPSRAGRYPSGSSKRRSVSRHSDYSSVSGSAANYERRVGRSSSQGRR